MSRSLPSAVLLGLVLSVMASPVLTKSDPETFRIRTFCIGESYFPEAIFPLLLLAGIILYTMMIKRRYYHEVNVTRAT